MVDSGTDRIYRERTRKLEREVADKSRLRATESRERAAVARFVDDVLGELSLRSRATRAADHVTTADFAFDAAQVVQAPSFAARPLYESYVTVIDDGAATGVVMVPDLRSASVTAGRQPGGEKTDVGATATTIDTLSPVEVVSAVAFNVSQQMVGYSPDGLLSRLFVAATESDFDAQIIATIEAVTASPAADLSAALATFAGSPFSPRVVVGGPAIVDVDVVRLQALGFAVVFDAHATATTVLDPAGVVLRRRPLVEDSKPEPSVVGVEMVTARFGELFVSPGAVATTVS